MSNNQVKLLLKGLDCANCANKIEEKVNNLDEVKEALMNFSLGKITVILTEEVDKEEIISKIKKIVNDLEPDVIVSEEKKASKSSAILKKEIKLNLKGLDCANCANKIEEKVNNLDQVKEALMNFSLGRLTIKPAEGVEKAQLIDTVTKIVNDLEPDVVVSEYSSKTIVRGNLNQHKHGESCGCGNHEHHLEHGEGCGCKGHEHHQSSSCGVHGHNNGESCGCGGYHHGHQDNHKNNHHKEDNENIEKEEGFFKKNAKLIVGIAFYLLALLLEDKGSISVVGFLISYVLVGGDVVMTALRNIKKGEIFDENFLMTVATVGALAIGEYPEALAVMIFYQIGEIFQSYAVNHSRKSITSLMNIKAEYANLLINGEEVKVNPEEIDIDDVIIIKPGERVALDGVIIEGNGSIDTSALTGESMPRDVKENDEILSGSINLDSVIKVRVTKTIEESTISRILEMVENASSKKANTEKLITRFCKYYTPIVVFCALALAFVPPLLIKDALFSEWIYRGLLFLVVSCPCALVISVPLGLFAGIGGASKNGILVKGGNYLEALKDVDTIVFDKTGTLTKGNFKVSHINPEGISKEELLEIAAMGESFSTHPIAESIVKEYAKEVEKDYIKEYKELSGHGISAVIKGEHVLIGNHKLMMNNDIECDEVDVVGTVIYVSANGKYRGNIIIQDEIKPDSKEAIKKLKSVGVKKVVMLTGDNDRAAQQVGKELGIDEIYSKLLPMDKVTKVEQLLNNKSKNGKLVFVGDGINDAPVLARADIGVAMGSIGSDAAIEAADLVLMKDNPSSLADAIKIGRKTSRILWQNIIFSLVIKVGVLILGAFGFATMWEAVFADVGVTILAILNSMRALKK